MGALALAVTPSAGAATTYQITVIPPIGTIYANNLITLGVSVGPVPVGADATTPVEATVTEPDGDSRIVTMPLTLGISTVVTPVDEPGRYSVVFTYAPPGGDEAEATLQFDAVPSPISGGSAS